MTRTASSRLLSATAKSADQIARLQAIVVKLGFEPRTLYVKRAAT